MHSSRVRCSYITVDFATNTVHEKTALHNSRKCVLIYNSCTIEDESNNKFSVLCHVLDNIGRLMSGKLVKVNPVFDGSGRYVAAPRVAKDTGKNKGVERVSK